MHGEQYGLLAKFSEHLPKRVGVLLLLFLLLLLGSD